MYKPLSPVRYVTLRAYNLCIAIDRDVFVMCRLADIILILTSSSVHQMAKLAMFDQRNFRSIT